MISSSPPSSFCPLQFHDLRYSRGTRQRLATRAWRDDWDRRHGILVVDHGNKTGKSYSELMASSVFCLAIIGAWKDGGREAVVAVPLPRAAPLRVPSPPQAMGGPRGWRTRCCTAASPSSSWTALTQSMPTLSTRRTFPVRTGKRWRGALGRGCFRRIGHPPMV